MVWGGTGGVLGEFNLRMVLSDQINWSGVVKVLSLFTDYSCSSEDCLGSQNKRRDEYRYR